MDEGYEPGEVEAGVLADLATLPENLQNGVIAATALLMARQLDNAGMIDLPARDAAAYIREIRLGVTALREQAPGGNEGDATDEHRQRRELRLQILPGGQAG
jgi:hypothetical protein